VRFRERNASIGKGTETNDPTRAGLAEVLRLNHSARITEDHGLRRFETELGAAISTITKDLGDAS